MIFWCKRISDIMDQCGNNEFNVFSIPFALAVLQRMFKLVNLMVRQDIFKLFKCGQDASGRPPV